MTALLAQPRAVSFAVQSVIMIQIPSARSQELWPDDQTAIVRHEDDMSLFNAGPLGHCVPADDQVEEPPVPRYSVSNQYYEISASLRSASTIRTP